MKIAEALALEARGRLSLVGGGGKSTLLIRLSRELAAEGRRTAAVTTTHITRAQGEGAGFLLCHGGAGALGAALDAHTAVCAASLCADGKLGPPPPVLAAALRLADWVLAEADGAGGRPIKAPADHEPVLLPEGITVAVAGLSALGRPLHQVCFRVEQAVQVLNVAADAEVTPALLARLLTCEGGQYKGVGDPSRFRVVLNQAECAPRGAVETANEILQLLPGCRVVSTALWEDDCVKGVFYRC